MLKDFQRLKPLQGSEIAELEPTKTLIDISGTNLVTSP